MAVEAKLDAGWEELLEKVYGDEAVGAATIIDIEPLPHQEDSGESCQGPTDTSPNAA
jgi:hypothetical protein